MSDKPISLIEKTQTQSDDLLESLREYIDGLEDREQPIGAIAIAVRFSNRDSAVTFHGDDFVGLLGVVQTLAYKLSMKIDESELKTINTDE